MNHEFKKNSEQSNILCRDGRFGVIFAIQMNKATEVYGVLLKTALLILTRLKSKRKLIKEQLVSWEAFFLHPRSPLNPSFKFQLFNYIIMGSVEIFTIELRNVELFLSILKFFCKPELKATYLSGQIINSYFFTDNNGAKSTVQRLCILQSL